MIERPILFNAEMALAVLAGKKTQTRRIIKPQPVWDEPLVEPSLGAGVWGRKRGIDWGDPDEPTWCCPYGIPGWGLWGRETWRPSFWDADFEFMSVEYRADGHSSKQIATDDLWPNDSRREDVFERLGRQLEKANCPRTEDGNWNWADTGNPLPWRPSIFMPRAASRISLMVTDVRVKRLQDISEADAIAEGVASVADYAVLWDKINGKGGWAANPWVWAVGFELRGGDS